MPLTRRSFVASATAAAAAGPAIGFPHVARAAEATLIFSSWLPPKHPTIVGAYRPWIEEIREKTDGRINIRLLGSPLGSAPMHFEMAREGVAHITYGLHSFTPSNKFLLTRMAEFSFLGDDAATLSKAYWDTYTSMFAAADEHAGTQLLGLYCHGPGALHCAARPIRTAEDLRGLKFRVPGGYVSSLLDGLGVVPMLTPSGEVYELLSNGVADGVAFTLEALTAFKLTALLDYTTMVPGGVYNTSWFLVMNQAKWETLEERDREVIRALSGAAFAGRVGEVWNEADAKALVKIKEAGIEVMQADDTLVAELKAVADPLEAAWAGQAQPRGFDGAAALRAVRAATGVRVSA